MSIFISIKWEKGIQLLINKCPSISKTIDLHTDAIAELSLTSQEELMNFFISINWQRGILLLINKYPSLAQMNTLHNSAKVEFLFVIGKYCSLATMGEVMK
eukprot:2339842-Ditylum_brightwellii.AAC.1